MSNIAKAKPKQKREKNIDFNLIFFEQHLVVYSIAIAEHDIFLDITNSRWIADNIFTLSRLD